MILPLLLPFGADAATFDVCATCTYTTIADAARAASAARSGRSTIRIAAGEYDETETITIYGDATIVGDGSDVTIVRSTADPVMQLGYHVDDGGLIATVSVSGLTLDGTTGDGISIIRSTANVADLRAQNLPGDAIYAWRGPLSIQGSVFAANATGVRFDGNTGGWPLDVTDSHFSLHYDSAIVAWDASVTVSDSVFEQNSGPSGGGAIVVANNAAALSGNTFSMNSGPNGGAVQIGTVGEFLLVGNRFCGNEGEYGGALLSASRVEGSGNIFSGNLATVAGGDLYLGQGGSLVNNTFVGGTSPTGGSVWAEYVSLDFRNNIVAYTSEYGLDGSGDGGTVAYNDFWEVTPAAVGLGWPAPDSTNLAVDPLFTDHVEGDCGDLGLAPGSPLVDAGDPSTFDTDGTVADIGATGGGVEGPREPQAWYRDADGDWYGRSDDVVYEIHRPAGYQDEAGDCDDADPDVHPYADERCDGIDQDCDGTVDDGTTTRWRLDDDGDGYLTAEEVVGCEPPEGWLDSGGPYDCDDGDPSVFPGAADPCDDAIDQDCDGADAMCGNTDSAVNQDPDDEGGAFRGGCRGCSSASNPSGALVLLAALVPRRPARRRHAGRVSRGTT
jgi:hypothetical protein